MISVLRGVDWIKSKHFAGYRPLEFFFPRKLTDSLTTEDLEDHINCKGKISKDSRSKKGESTCQWHFSFEDFWYLMLSFMHHFVSKYLRM